MWALLAGILREVGRAGNGVGAIDGREQSQIAAGVVHLAAAIGNGILVLPHQIRS